MATADSTELPVINGFHPFTALDIECTGHITYEQAKAMGAIFRTISRLTEDREIRDLCEHGALQADLQANDIDCQIEAITNAGVHHG